MDIPKLSEDIVIRRQKNAPLIQDMMNRCDAFGTKLRAILSALGQLSSDAPEMQKFRLEIFALIDESDKLRERLAIRHARFQSGLITISIAGLEKAGKTTFLRSLTGIESLPAFDERCTAVCCEIHYAQDRADFDIEFYSEAEFMERVIKPVAETIMTALPEPIKSQFRPPVSAVEFINLVLPLTDCLAGGTTAFKLLRDFGNLQRYFEECRQNLGRPPLSRRPLSELKQWVSHKPANSQEDDEELRGRHLARVSAAKVCRIHTAFKGGSPHLRWIDTPGVDDPNRRARELTLGTIASETDLLAVTSRPGATPSPNENFHNFWDSVSVQPDEIDLLNRMVFVLNWDRRVDPEGENIKIHRKYLIDAGVPRHIFAGPFEAIRESDAAQLMERVNAHLAAHLPEQDEHVIREFESKIKNIQARIRLLHDAMKKSHPSDATQQDMEYEEFQKWFHWYHGDQDKGFWTELVAALDHATRDILEDPKILESENALNDIFAKEAKKIQTQIPQPKELEEYLIRHRGENPIPNAMRSISTQFSRLVNRLSYEIQEFGPIMQDKIASVLSKAGLEPLLNGKNSEEKLKNLIDSFHPSPLPLSPERREGNTDRNSVVEVLREALELPRNLKYVLRYELREAVDFCDPTLWNEKEQAWKRLTDMVTANGSDIEKLAKFDTKKHPPVTDSREQDYEILKKIAGNAMLAIYAVLNNERYLPRRIADDFMRDCRVRLCFAPESEQEWRTLLFKNRGVLLAATIGQIRAKSERIRAFHTALNDLESGLP